MLNSTNSLRIILVNMPYFVLFLFFDLFLLSFPVHGSSGVSKDSFHYCSNDTFSPNSIYLSNLETLFSQLSSNASIKFYHNSSVGRPPNPTVYADFQCRGDLDATTCQQCVATATANSLKKFCPLSMEAVIWMEECVLRYSNQSFFSFIAEYPWLFVFNVLSVEKNVVEAFDNIVGTALNATVKKASSMHGALKFAIAEVNFRDVTVYTTAQCSGDLSNFNCEKCLRRAAEDLHYHCRGRKGARTLFFSCTLRYELYQFYGSVSPFYISIPPVPASVPVVPPPADFSSVPAAPPPLLSGKGRGAVAMNMMIGVVVATYFLCLEFSRA